MYHSIGNVNHGESTEGEQGACEKSVSSAQFHYESETPLKKNNALTF